MASGLTSVATQSRVVAENLLRLLDMPGVPPVLISLGFLLLWRASSRAASARACGSTCSAPSWRLGLALVIVVGFRFLGSADLFETPSPEGIGASLLLQGAILTFFAFIGFEDTLNVAEECHNPSRTVPIGIISAMLVATALYMAVAITAVSVVPWRELAAAPGPLAEVMARAAPWMPGWVYVAITVFAVANTALLNYVTASRLTYGMARQGLLPAVLGRVHPRTRTPHVAVGALLVVVVALMLAGDIGQLASATVLLLLAVFACVNVALLVLQRRPGRAARRLRGAVLRAGAGGDGLPGAAGQPGGGRGLAAPALAGAVLVVIVLLLPGDQAARGGAAGRLGVAHQ
jgi:amino acid transporter